MQLRSIKRLSAVLVAGLAVSASVAFSGGIETARDAKVRAYDQVTADLQDGVNHLSNAVPFGAACEGGLAGPFECSNIDLLATVTPEELGGVAAADSWGWVDDETDDEYIVMGTGVNSVIVRITDPTAPEVMGKVPSTSTDSGIVWRDIKVHDDHAYIVSENAGHGIQIVDMTQFRDMEADPNRTITPDETFGDFAAHNIAINPETDTLLVNAGSICNGGLGIFDISDPQAPVEEACFDEGGAVHDSQCVIYRGPDADHNGTADGTPHEICFLSNEERGLYIIDITDRENIEVLAQHTYPEIAYTHQGWITPNHRWFIFGDELDEDPALGGGTVSNTTTYWVNLDDLDKGIDRKGEFVQRHTHATKAIDHNLYTKDDLAFMANYTAGLRVMRYSDEGLANGEMEEVAFFDMHPATGVSVFAGAWSVYPYFPSGTITVSTFDEGLFILKMNLPDSP